MFYTDTWRFLNHWSVSLSPHKSSPQRLLLASTEGAGTAIHSRTLHSPSPYSTLKIRPLKRKKKMSPSPQGHLPLQRLTVNEESQAGKAKTSSSLKFSSPTNSAATAPWTVLVTYTGFTVNLPVSLWHRPCLDHGGDCFKEKQNEQNKTKQNPQLVVRTGDPGVRFLRFSSERPEGVSSSAADH